MERDYRSLLLPPHFMFPKVACYRKKPLIFLRIETIHDTLMLVNCPLVTYIPVITHYLA